MEKQHRYTYIVRRDHHGSYTVTLYKDGMQLHSDRYLGYFGIAWWQAQRRASSFRRIYNATSA